MFLSMASNIMHWGIPRYTLRLVGGVLGGIIWLWATAPRAGYQRDQLPGLLWLVSGGAILMGRLGYVVGQWPYFTQNPAAILALRRVGGLHGGSAWVGGLMVTGIWAQYMRRTWFDVVCFLAPAALLMATGAWWGCLDVGCAWGREVVPGTSLWPVVEAPDIYHIVLPRYAVQYLGMGSALLSAILAAWAPPCGALVLSLYLALDAGLTQLRADPVPRIGPYRVDLLLSLTLALILWCMQWRAKVGQT